MCIRDRLNEIEYYYLVSTLIEAIPFVSNTTGTYGAYLKHWDKRALKPLELIPLEVQNKMCIRDRVWGGVRLSYLLAHHSHIHDY